LGGELKIGVEAPGAEAETSQPLTVDLLAGR